jgi:HK97 gp10 family phage protein
MAVNRRDSLRVFKKLNAIRNYDPMVTVYKYASATQKLARELVPVDTGSLRLSILLKNESDTKTNRISIGTNLEYAPYMEYGTRLTRARPYLRPAFYAYSERFQNELKTNLRKIIR